MREPVAKVIGKPAGKNLGLIFQAAEGTRVNNAVTVSLIVVTIRMRGFGILASARILCAHSQVLQREGCRTAGHGIYDLRITIDDFGKVRSKKSEVRMAWKI
jgi:hypothetical protein